MADTVNKPINATRIKAERFVDTLIDNDFNISDSGRELYPTYKTDNSKRVAAYQKMRTPSVQLVLKERLELLGIGDSVRNIVLRNIIDGSHIKTTKKTVKMPLKDQAGHPVFDDNGEPRTYDHIELTESSPSAGEIIKAIDIINKCTGAYREQDQRSRRSRNVTAEAEAVLRQIDTEEAEIVEDDVQEGPSEDADGQKDGLGGNEFAGGV